MFRDLSMIIPMKENNYMIDTLLQYHAPTGIKIYIVHDSKQEYTVPKQLNVLGNIHYFRMPNVSYNERVSFALEHIDTEYCVFRADRRHQSTASLQNALHFLRENEGYSSASGIWLNQNLTLYHCSELISSNGELDDVLARLEGQGLSYQPPYYNVQKTSLIRVYFDTLKRIDTRIPNIFYHEHIHAFLCFFTGKTKQFPSLAGVIQNKRKPAEYAMDWFKAMDIFNSAEDTEFVAIVLKNVLKKHAYSHENVHVALQVYLAAVALRFVIYRINLYGYSQEKVQSFGYMEDMYELLNSADASQEKLIRKFLRAFMALDYDCKSTFEHVKGGFSTEDFAEFKNIHKIMESIESNMPC